MRIRHAVSPSECLLQSCSPVKSRHCGQLRKSMIWHPRWSTHLFSAILDTSHSPTHVLDSIKLRDAFQFSVANRLMFSHKTICRVLVLNLENAAPLPSPPFRQVAGSSFAVSSVLLEIERPGYNPGTRIELVRLQQHPTNPRRQSVMLYA
jgi:hypothetical protein